MAKSMSKSVAVFLKLRDEIIHGHFKPGQQLPTFDQLEKKFSASRTVLQQALWRLRGEGFVYSVNKQGLYVSPNPPYLNRYGLVFPGVPDETTWSRFNTAIVNEARRLESAGFDCDVETFVGVTEDNITSIGYRKLREDVESHRLAGLIMMPGTFFVAKQPPFNNEKLPKVFVFGKKHKSQPLMIALDGDAFFTMALDWLKSRGRRRIAVIRMGETELSPDVVLKAGLECHPQWMQLIGRSHPFATRQLVSLLLDYPAEQRPDGLIITDDNLVEHASAGLIDTGLQIGKDIDVVAHCNWPWAVPSVLPMKRLGIHAGDLLARCINMINAFHRNGVKENYQVVPMLFEEDVVFVHPRIDSPTSQQQQDDAAAAEPAEYP